MVQSTKREREREKRKKNRAVPPDPRKLATERHSSSSFRCPMIRYRRRSPYDCCSSIVTTRLYALLFFLSSCLPLSAAVLLSCAIVLPCCSVDTFVDRSVQTYNLWHLLARENSGVPPVLRVNDGAWDELQQRLHECDGIVLSPGPGQCQSVCELPVCLSACLAVCRLSVLSLSSRDATSFSACCGVCWWWCPVATCKGHPSNVHDFGHCGPILLRNDEWDVPILG